MMNQRMHGYEYRIDDTDTSGCWDLFAPVIPTKTGSITIDLKGEINGIKVDVQVPIEDVESTAILDFPSLSKQSSNSDITALKNAISSLQKEILFIKSDSGIKDVNKKTSYDFAVFGISFGAAGVILAILSMTKKEASQLDNFCQRKNGQVM